MIVITTEEQKLAKPCSKQCGGYIGQNSWNDLRWWIMNEDYIIHLNTLFEEFCHEFDDIHSIEKKESKREGT